MKRKEKAEERSHSKVTCTWCGGAARHPGVKDARRMCQACHARMLSEHLRAHRAEPMFEYASDR